MSLREAEEDLSRALSFIRVGDHARVEAVLRRAVTKLMAHRARARRSNEPGDLLELGWKELDDERRLEQCLLLRAATLTAEMADYRGDAELAGRALLPFAQIVEDLEKQRHKPAAMLDFPNEDDLLWKLLRQELYCAWQVAVREYRHGRVVESRKIIDTAIHIAETMRPGSGGLLTQLYYAQAKLRLRERAFVDATVMFRKSLTSASVRFSNAGSGRDLERKAAQYSVAKALCLGLAQSLLDQGRLIEAHTVVVGGRMLLDLTPDLVHRAYAQQLLGSIERASARDSDTILLASAKNNLEQAEAFLGARKPWAAFRARYELGLIDLHLGDRGASERRLSALLRDAEDAQSVKWMAMAHVGLSRVARQMKDFKRAVDEAEEARTIAKEKKFRNIEINGHTAQVLALFEQHADDPDRLGEVEDVVHELLRKIPEEDARNRVMGLLVLTRILAARKELRRARAAYESYERIAHLVQSPRIHDMAELALHAISPNVFLCPADQLPPVFDLKRNEESLQEYVVNKVAEYYDTPEERAGALHVGVSTYYRYANSRDK